MSGDRHWGIRDETNGKVLTARREPQLLLAAATRKGLELNRTQREERREGSLLAALDRTVTSMGARLLQDWLLAPPTGRPSADSPGFTQSNSAA